MDEDAPEAIEQPSVSERLSAAREEKGLSREDVARTTRVPIRHLQHIDAGEWEALPAVTYSVGFARAYANAVGLDGPAVGAEVRELLGGARRASAVAPSIFEPADPSRVPPRSIAIGAALAGVLLVAAWLLWDNSRLDEAPRDGAGGESAIVETAGPGARAPAGPAPKPVAIPTEGPVALVASADVWIRVTDGDRYIFSGILSPGQRYDVPPDARAPRIRTGRPDRIRPLIAGRLLPPLGSEERIVENVSLLAADLASGPAPTPPPGAT